MANSTSTQPVPTIYIDAGVVTQDQDTPARSQASGTPIPKSGFATNLRANARKYPDQANDGTGGLATNGSNAKVEEKAPTELSKYQVGGFEGQNVKGAGGYNSNFRPCSIKPSEGGDNMLFSETDNASLETSYKPGIEKSETASTRIPGGSFGQQQPPTYSGSCGSCKCDCTDNCASKSTYETEKSQDASDCQGGTCNAASPDVSRGNIAGGLFDQQKELCDTQFKRSNIFSSAASHIYEDEDPGEIPKIKNAHSETRKGQLNSHTHAELRGPHQEGKEMGEKFRDVAIGAAAKVHGTEDKVRGGVIAGVTKGLGIAEAEQKSREVGRKGKKEVEIETLNREQPEIVFPKKTHGGSEGGKRVG